MLRWHRLLRCGRREVPNHVDLAVELAAHVPQTFATLSNLTTKLPAPLAVRVAEVGGLKEILSSHPSWFALSKIGRVEVARRLSGAPCATVDEPSVKSSSLEDNVDAGQLHLFPHWAAENLAPRFTAPLDAVVVAMEELSCSTSRSLSRSSKVQQPTGDGSAENLIHGLCASGTVEVVRGLVDTSLTFVRPRHVHRFRRSVMQGAASLQQSAVDAAENVAPSEVDGGVALLSELEKHLMESHQGLVHDYECARIARYLSCDFRVLDAALVSQCSGVLDTQVRTLDHVLLSAPDRFQLRRGSDGRHEVRYLLPPPIRSSGEIPFLLSTPAMVQAAQEKLAAMRRERFPPRQKIRAILRQIQRSVEPSPYLDPDVFAHALLDELPVEGPPVSMQTLMDKCMTSSQRSCRPIHTASFLESYRHLFVATQPERNTNFYFLARADSYATRCIADAEGTSTASDEEVVVTLFEMYPRSKDPSEGLRYEAIHKRLPARVRRAVGRRGLRNIIEAQSDNIEVLEFRAEEAEQANESLVGTFGGASRPHPSSHGHLMFRMKGPYMDSLKLAFEERYPNRATN